MKIFARKDNIDNVIYCKFCDQIIQLDNTTADFLEDIIQQD